MACFDSGYFVFYYFYYLCGTECIEEILCALLLFIPGFHFGSSVPTTWTELLEGI